MTDGGKKPSLVRRWLHKLYPPHEEIAIYTTSVSLIALAIVSAEFREALFFVTQVFLVEFPREGFTVSIWKGIWSVFGGYMLVLTCLASLMLSLYLPFTRRRMDTFLEMVIVAHVIMILTSNVLAFDESQNFLTWFIFIASTLYVFIFSIGHRFRIVHIRISDRHASAQQGFIAAVAVSLLVALLSLGFKLHWAHCYAVSTAFAIGIAKAFTPDTH